MREEAVGAAPLIAAVLQRLFENDSAGPVTFVEDAERAAFIYFIAMPDYRRVLAVAEDFMDYPAGGFDERFAYFQAIGIRPRLMMCSEDWFLLLSHGFLRPIRTTELPPGLPW